MSKLQIVVAMIVSIIFGGILVFVFGVLAYFAGPRLEQQFFPILRAEHIADSLTRNGQSICWSTNMTKLRAGDPAYFEYLIERKVIEPDDDGRPRIVLQDIPAAPYRMQDGIRHYLSRRGFADTHKPGSNWETTYCIDLPTDIGPTDEFFVIGNGYFDVPHGFWQVPQKLPSFAVRGPISKTIWPQQFRDVTGHDPPEFRPIPYHFGLVR